MTKEPTLRRLAAALLAATGALHLALAPEYWGEQHYVGALFVAGGLVSAAIAARLWRAADPRAWALGALTAAGMAVGFVLSRTVGLPGFHEADWEASGLLSLLIEAGVVGLALRAVGARSRAAASSRA